MNTFKPTLIMKGSVTILFGVFLLLSGCSQLQVNNEETQILEPDAKMTIEMQSYQKQELPSENGQFLVKELNLNIQAVEPWKLFIDQFGNYQLSQASIQEADLYNSISIFRLPNDELNQGLYETGIWGDAFGLINASGGEWTQYITELLGSNPNDEMFIFVLKEKDYFYELHIPSSILELKMLDWFIPN